MSENIKKDLHHIHDKSYKDLYSKKEIAVDLFKSLVDKKWTKYLVPENLTLVNKSYITADYNGGRAYGCKKCFYIRRYER